MVDNFHKLLEYITIGASLHDEFGNFIYINPVFCKMFDTNMSRVELSKFNDKIFDITIDNQDTVIDYLNINFKKIDNYTIKIRKAAVNDCFSSYDLSFFSMLERIILFLLMVSLSRYIFLLPGSDRMEYSGL